MLDQLAGAQIELAALIAELARAGASTADASNQLHALTSLQQQLGSATPAGLASLRNEIATAVTASGHLVAQSRNASERARDAAESMAEMAELAAEARQQVAGLLRDMHQFDALLAFGSAAQEEDYRSREAERRAAIEAELAKGTPQGDLNASGIMLGQMTDAAAHGAAGDPEFDKRFNALVDSTRALRDRLIAEGKDVSQFDRDVKEDLRRILKSKGQSDAEIDAYLSAHPDPIDAMQGVVAEQRGALNERDVAAMEMRASEAGRTSAVVTNAVVASPAAAPPADLPASALDAMAGLRAMGVVAAEHDASINPTHGVTVQVVASTDHARRV